MGKNLWAFIFSNKGNLLIANWQEEVYSASKKIVVQTDAAKAETVDIMGNHQPVPLVEGMALLEVTSTPSTLLLEKAGSVKALGDIINIKNTQVGVPGKSISCPVALFNPFKTTKEFNLAMRLPKGLSATQTNKNITVKSASTVNADMVFEISKDLKNKYKENLSFDLEYSIAGTPWKGIIKVPVNLAISIPQGSFDRPADFIIDKRTDVTSLCEADPAKSHLVWKNAADLSARIWTGTDGKNLLVKAEVTDDVHNQKNQNANVWKGDNIQLGLQIIGQPTFWEIGLTHLDSQKPQIWVWNAPDGFSKENVKKSSVLKTSRKGKVTTYEVAIPLESIGTSVEKLKKGIRFNLLVNDNDENVREGWIRVAPGIGSMKISDKFPFLIFE